MAPSPLQLIDSTKTIAPLNPSLPEQIRDLAKKLVENHSETSPMVWIASSGTTSHHNSSLKLIGLTQEALLASAHGVNEFLQVIASDRWLNVLPLFHVGGLGILYRAKLANCECINLWNETFKWNPGDFVHQCNKHKITLSSLVPTQVFDLVAAGFKAPPSMRAIVIGGARLSDELFLKARQLGWPLLPSFGMTEAGSQIATTSLTSLSQAPEVRPPLLVLPHMSARSDDDNRLYLAGLSLFEGYYSILEGKAQPWTSRKVEDGWWRTQDRAQVVQRQLEPLGRADEVIKIRGENVNLASLRNQLEIICQQKGAIGPCTLVAIPDPRLGHKLILVGEDSEAILKTLMLAFDQVVLPFERINSIIANTPIPRNGLGKIQHAQLLSMLHP